MASNQWQVDFSGIEELVDNLKRIPEQSETLINVVIHNDGIQIAIDEIQPEIPVSQWKNRVRKKKHARNEKNPQVSQKSNLSFTIKPKPKFNYLKYPDLGIGTSSKNPPKQFMKKGLDEASPKIIEKLNEEINKNIEQILGGN